MRALWCIALLLVAAHAAWANLLPDEVSGSEAPPAAFGKLAKPWFGCPILPGVYAWPPVEGGLGGPPVPGRRGPPQYQISVGGYVLSDPFYLGFDAPNERQRIRVKIALAPGDLPEPVTPARIPWKRQTLANSEYSCHHGWLVLGDLDVKGEPSSWYGGNASSVLKFAPLANGDLVVGRAVRVSGRSGSLFAWGDTRGGTIPLSDRVLWRWARLRRVAEVAATTPDVR